MSYSFTVKAANKAAAKVAIAAEWDKIIASQPAHAFDREVAEAHAGHLVDMLPDDDSQDVSVSANGYVSWRGLLGADDFVVTGCSVAANAGLTSRSV